MQFYPTKLSDVVIVDPRVFDDKRGYFMETYNEREFSKSGFELRFVQTNMSSSKRGTLRGLHYQLAPYAQGKLVRVVKGTVFDVAVDLRKGSPAFGQWVGIELSEYNKRSVYIPPGFAHGFYVLSDIAEFLYQCTAFYNPKAERGILWKDREIAIEWPIVGSLCILSEKDEKLPLLKDAEINFTYEG